MGLLEWILLVGIASPIAAYAIGGIMHVAIDFFHGRRILRKYWTETDAKIERIQETVTASILASLPAAPVIPPFPELPPPPNLESLKVEILQGVEELIPETPGTLPDLGPSLEAWFRSESGLGWARELSSSIQKGLLAYTSSAVGSHHRRTSNDGVNVILNSAIDFGSPLLNGAWVMAPADAKRKAIQSLVGVLRRAGWQLVPIATVSAQDVGLGEQLMLDGEVPGSGGDWR